MVYLKEEAFALSGSFVCFNIMHAILCISHIPFLDTVLTGKSPG